MKQYAQQPAGDIGQKNDSTNESTDQFRFQDRFIAFDEYIAQKYAKELSQLLQDDLIEGYDGEASIKVRKRTAEVELLYCWQDGENEISGIVHYSAECKIVVDGKDDSCVCECNIWFTACLSGGRVDCDFQLFRDELNTIKHMRYDDRLCRYLLPRAGTQRVEQICEGILRFYCPEAFTHNRLVDPKDLASALGLKIVYLPLRGMDSKCSLLVMEDTELPTRFGHVKENNEMTAVARNTIVLNTNHRYCTEKAASHIAHECYHFAGQRLFNQFQMISHSEYPSLAGKHEHNYDEAEALHWMEWQAYVGSSFIRYPGSYVRDDLRDALRKYAPVSAHAGVKFQKSIFSMADIRNVPVNLAKKAVQYTKHPEAKGACNYMNGEYQRPFAFDPDKCAGPYAYIINLIDLIRLCADTPKLRYAMSRGKLVYADGHICANNPAYVRKNEEGLYKLTDHALERVDRCCLRFFIDYNRRDTFGYKVGILNCDDRQISYTSKLAKVCGCETGLIGLTFTAHDTILALPVKFGDTLRYYREKAELKQNALATDAGLDERTIRRIENFETTEIPFSVAIRLAYALKLEVPYLRDFLRRAGYIPDSSPAGFAMELIIEQLNTLDVDLIKELADEYEAIRHAATLEEAISRMVKIHGKSATSPKHRSATV